MNFSVICSYACDGSISHINSMVDSNNLPSLCKQSPFESHLTSSWRSNCLRLSSFSSHSLANSRERSGLDLISLIAPMHTWRKLLISGLRVFWKLDAACVSRNDNREYLLELSPLRNPRNLDSVRSLLALHHTPL